MADVVVSATLDLGDVEKVLDGMQHRAHALGAVFRELKAPLRLDQKDHRKKREGPSAVWAPAAASTRARRLSSPKHRPSRLLGRLPGAVSYKADSNSVTGTSRVMWSGVHQDGGTVGHGSRLPSRPFLWISDGVIRVAETALGGALVRAFGGN